MNRWKSLYVCDDCWSSLHPSGRQPVRVSIHAKEECCLCDNDTESGIYVRALITVKGEGDG